VAAEAPGAILDDHTRWRRPLAEAAARLRLLGWLSIVLIGATMAAMITLAANASLAANAQVVKVLRLIGAQDSYIARAFVRRFTLRALTGSAAGALAGLAGVLLLPAADAAGGFLTGLAFRGPLALALHPAALAALVAFAATRRAAFKKLKELT
jgi:cell division transport system permease protein